MQEWFDAGLRMVQPAYSSNLPAFHQRAANKLAGGADEPGQGLTELGRQVIHELVRRHMVIDVSHCSEKTTFDIIEMTAVPILANHAQRQDADGGDAGTLSIGAKQVESGVVGHRRDGRSDRSDHGGLDAGPRR